jgi:hypothetical protein
VLKAGYKFKREIRFFVISKWSSIALAIAVFEIAKAISLLHYDLS